MDALRWGLTETTCRPKRLGTLVILAKLRTEDESDSFAQQPAEPGQLRRQRGQRQASSAFWRPSKLISQSILQMKSKKQRHKTRTSSAARQQDRTLLRRPRARVSKKTSARTESSGRDQEVSSMIVTARARSTDRRRCEPASMRAGHDSEGHAQTDALRQGTHRDYKQAKGGLDVGDPCE